LKDNVIRLTVAKIDP